MATLQEFGNILGPLMSVPAIHGGDGEFSIQSLKEAIIEEGNKMDFRNEMVQEIQSKPANPNRDTGEETKHIKVCCYPTEVGKYGNNYSNFLSLTQITQMFGGLDPDDFKDKKVRIGFTEREYVNSFGKPSKAKDLGYIKFQDVDVNDEAESGQPVLAVSEPLCAPLTGKVTTSVPLPLPDTPSPAKQPLTANDAMRNGAIDHGSLGNIIAASIAAGFYGTEQQAMQGSLRWFAFIGSIASMTNAQMEEAILALAEEDINR